MHTVHEGSANGIPKITLQNVRHTIQDPHPSSRTPPPPPGGTPRSTTPGSLQPVAKGHGASPPSGPSPHHRAHPPTGGTRHDAHRPYHRPSPPSSPLPPSPSPSNTPLLSAIGRRGVWRRMITSFHLIFHPKTLLKGVARFIGKAQIRVSPGPSDQGAASEDPTDSGAGFSVDPNRRMRKGRHPSPSPPAHQITAGPRAPTPPTAARWRTSRARARRRPSSRPASTSCRRCGCSAPGAAS